SLVKRKARENLAALAIGLELLLCADTDADIEADTEADTGAADTGAADPVSAGDTSDTGAADTEVGINADTGRADTGSAALDAPAAAAADTDISDTGDTAIVRSDTGKVMDADTGAADTGAAAVKLDTVDATTTPQPRQRQQRQQSMRTPRAACHQSPPPPSTPSPLHPTFQSEAILVQACASLAQPATTGLSLAQPATTGLSTGLPTGGEGKAVECIALDARALSALEALVAWVPAISKPLDSKKTLVTSGGAESIKPAAGTGATDTGAPDTGRADIGAGQAAEQDVTGVTAVVAAAHAAAAHAAVATATGEGDDTTETAAAVLVSAGEVGAVDSAAAVAAAGKGDGAIAAVVASAAPAADAVAATADAAATVATAALLSALPVSVGGTGVVVAAATADAAAAGDRLTAAGAGGEGAGVATSSGSGGDSSGGGGGGGWPSGGFAAEVDYRARTHDAATATELALGKWPVFHFLLPSLERTLERTPGQETLEGSDPVSAPVFEVSLQLARLAYHCALARPELLALAARTPICSAAHAAALAANAEGDKEGAARLLVLARLCDGLYREDFNSTSGDEQLSTGTTVQEPVVSSVPYFGKTSTRLCFERVLFEAVTTEAAAHASPAQLSHRCSALRESRTQLRSERTTHTEAASRLAEGAIGGAARRALRVVGALRGARPVAERATAAMARARVVDAEGCALPPERMACYCFAPMEFRCPPCEAAHVILAQAEEAATNAVRRLPAARTDSTGGVLSAAVLGPLGGDEEALPSLRGALERWAASGAGSAQSLDGVIEATLRRNVRSAAVAHFLGALQAPYALDASFDAHARALHLAARSGRLCAAAVGLDAQIAPGVDAASFVSARSELRLLASTSHPRLKLARLLRAWECVLGVLATLRPTPAADDFMPALVAVFARAHVPLVLGELTLLANWAARDEREDMWLCHALAALTAMSTLDPSRPGQRLAEPLWRPLEEPAAAVAVLAQGVRALAEGLGEEGLGEAEGGGASDGEEGSASSGEEEGADDDQAGGPFAGAMDGFRQRLPRGGFSDDLDIPIDFGGSDDSDAAGSATDDDDNGERSAKPAGDRPSVEPVAEPNAVKPVLGGPPRPATMPVSAGVARRGWEVFGAGAKPPAAAVALSGGVSHLPVAVATPVHADVLPVYPASVAASAGYPAAVSAVAVAVATTATTPSGPVDTRGRAAAVAERLVAMGFDADSALAAAVQLGPGANFDDALELLLGGGGGGGVVGSNVALLSGSDSLRLDASEEDGGFDAAALESIFGLGQSVSDPAAGVGEVSSGGGGAFDVGALEALLLGEQAVVIVPQPPPPPYQPPQQQWQQQPPPQQQAGMDPSAPGAQWLSRAPGPSCSPVSTHGLPRPESPETPALRSIVDMGFTRSDARSALKLTGGNTSPSPTPCGSWSKPSPSLNQAAP
ncbi:hypothetical protein T492DRAFT_947326, partial [Pavlovales sp. CCMP2436]